MASQFAITHALIIRKGPLDKILRGNKTWEVRGSDTKRRGLIALIEGGSGLIVGACELVTTVGPLTLATLQRNARKAGFRADGLYYERTFAWVLRGAQRLRRPVPYRHRRGVVIWARLSAREAARVRAALRRGSPSARARATAS